MNDNIQGVCPVCHSDDLDYKAIEFEGDMAYFPYTCHNCNFSGEEWYNMDFNGHNAVGLGDYEIDNIEIEYIDLEKIRKDNNIDMVEGDESEE